MNRHGNRPAQSRHVINSTNHFSIRSDDRPSATWRRTTTINQIIWSNASNNTEEKKPKVILTGIFNSAFNVTQRMVLWSKKITADASSISSQLWNSFGQFPKLHIDRLTSYSTDSNVLPTRRNRRKTHAMGRRKAQMERKKPVKVSSRWMVAEKKPN